MQETVEEKHPLLSMFVNDGKKNSTDTKYIFIEKGRNKGILSGATAVFTEWPNHLTTCWLTTLIFGLAVTILLLFAAALRPLRCDLLPKCKHIDKREMTNKTRIFLVHTAEDLERPELESIEKMLQNFPNYFIDITIFQKPSVKRMLTDKMRTPFVYLHSLTPSPSTPNQFYPTLKPKVNDVVNVENKVSSTSTRNKRDADPAKNLKYRSKFFDWYDDLDFNINIGSKKLLNLLMKRRMDNDLTKNKTLGQKSTTEPPKITSLEGLMSNYPAPRITVKRISASEYFENTPLQNTYTIFRPDIVVFAARVIKLWDNGGISFELPKTLKNTTNGDGPSTSKRNCAIAERNQKINDLIGIGATSFENLPAGIVTVDDEGLHMETKTTCHAFFGEILMNIRRANRASSVTSIIKKTLQSFCRKNAVDSSYCDNLDS